MYIALCVQHPKLNFLLSQYFSQIISMVSCKHLVKSEGANLLYVINNSCPWQISLTDVGQMSLTDLDLISH